MAVVDWGAMSDRENRETDRNRATKAHEVNKNTRKREVIARKKRTKEYTDDRKKYKAYIAKQTKKILATVRAPVVYIEPPRTQAIASVIPTAVEFPTAKMVGTDGMASLPWSTIPSGMALPFVTQAIGMMIVLIGNRVVASLAGRFDTDVSGLTYTVGRSDIRLRVRTGKGEGAGRYVRPRGAGGASVDDDADPYEQPSEWYEFWKWSF